MDHVTFQLEDSLTSSIHKDEPQLTDWILVSHETSVGEKAVTQETAQSKQLKKRRLLILSNPIFSVNVSNLKMHLRFHRNYAKDIMQSFVPSLMLSIASSGSLYILPERLAERLALSSTTFLTLVSVFSGAR